MRVNGSTPRRTGCAHRREGRANEYELIGVNTGGAWRKLPQDALLENGKLILRDLPRSRKSLNALKVFYAMTYLHNEMTGTAALSYNGIQRWSGVRRSEIREALAMLAIYGLIRPSNDRDHRHDIDGDNDQSTRYEIRGLSRSWNATPPWATTPPAAHTPNNDQPEQYLM